jgi:lipopolysaccharide transport system ATP-binding protein
VRGLSKSYTIAHNDETHITLAETALAWAKNPLRRGRRETFWALKDISFEIEQGDVVGIIGHNGAGKSTLLKVLSRITGPAKGEIDLYGRVGSLLEVGTGFHPELTGRENIYLNGAILGMSRREIAGEFDNIVNFAEIEQFLDTPVKRYSSGMYVRLAFAVAAHLSCEILIVDEVLAVGDAEFQRKALAKIREVSRGGRTILFVSHNMVTIRELCNRGLVLHRGALTYFGGVDEAVDHYLAVAAPDRTLADNVSAHGLGLATARLRHRHSGRDTNAPILNDDYELVLEFNALRPLKHCAFVLSIRDHLGTLVSTICSIEEGLGTVTLSGRQQTTFNLPRLQLLPGRYRIDVSVRKLYTTVRYLDHPDALRFEMHTAAVNGAPHGYAEGYGFVRISDGASLCGISDAVGN